MHITITGAAGMLGTRLAQALLNLETVIGRDGQPHSITKLTLFDRVLPQGLPQADPRLEMITGDITNPETLNTLVTSKTELIFHLAAIVSGEAEQNFELGMQVNLQATERLLEVSRHQGTMPRFVFPSSVAVYGGDMPDIIEDDTPLTPQSSYGTQKAMSELLINDYSRRGFVDGRVLRLPTIVVRPGRPNKATSTFASSIIREPLQGESAICPVMPETRLWILSPRCAVESFVHAATLPPDVFGASRSVALPGVSVSVAEMMESLRTVAGRSVANRVSWAFDPFIQRIVGSWPGQFNPEKALALGFKADASMAAIIEAFIEDDLT
ncbi:MAG: D-erythronate dehydrogenase [Chloroflexota bacterium]